MSDYTKLGSFATRQLNVMISTALAGAKRQVAHLQRLADDARRDLEMGEVPSMSLSGAADSAENWLAQLRLLRDIEGVLAADQEDILADLRNEDGMIPDDKRAEADRRLAGSS